MSGNMRWTLCFLSSGLWGAVLGCGSPTSSPSTTPERYPVRADWLVPGQIGVTEQPSGWHTPGYPPLLQLDSGVDLTTSTAPEGILARGLMQNRKLLYHSGKLLESERVAFGAALDRLFGTPEKPKVDSEEAVRLFESKMGSFAGGSEQATEVLEQLRKFKEMLKLDEPTLVRGGKLYRNYCEQCHGFSGDGNGPGSSRLIPLPRDYRQGLFKFITSDPDKVGKRKPRRADLRRTIVRGLDGAPMPSFAALSASEVDALVSYVIHLSIRGETEYQTMVTFIKNEEDEETISPKSIERFTTICRDWVASELHPVVPTPDPYQTPAQRLEAAADGFRLFAADEKSGGGAGCAKCHIQFGKGDAFKFDDWGGISRARNLTQPVLRGTRQPDEVYARILGGIPGAGMPAHTSLRPTDAERAAGKDKLWMLTHFVLIAAEAEGRRQLKEKYQIEIDP